MINKERVQRVIDGIKAEEFLKFNMSMYFMNIAEEDYVDFEAGNLCASAACIAGFAAAYEATDKGEKHVDYYDTFENACNWLGISTEQGHGLFTPEDWRCEEIQHDNITGKMAVNVLERLLKHPRTGRERILDWWEDALAVPELA
ncbi:MAG: hypothetical protein NXH70_02245 [Hyphomonas sp.]|nr:hypothetical protein [Hyphomonas sp.]